MKKFLSVVLAAVICLSLAACGGTPSGQPVEKTENAVTGVETKDTENTVTNTENRQTQNKPAAPRVQDIVAFLDDMKPYYDRKVKQGDAGVFRVMNYNLILGGEALIEQYIDTITSADYDLSLTETYVKELEDVTYTYYYIKYNGSGHEYFESDDIEHHINIAVSTYKYRGEAEITFGYADGFEYVDDGHRADYAKMQVTPVLTPKPTPTPEPTPRPTSQPADKPAQKPAVPVVETVDKNASLIPDFTAFLNRSPSEDKDRYYGGTRKYYQKNSLDTQNTVVSEVLNLLNKDRYQLELIEKVDAGDRVEYNYRYTGNVSMDMIHSRNDDSRYYNLQFTVYNKNNDNGTYGIHFHYSPQFVEENVGYTVSAALSGGGGGGGTNEFDGGDLPDHSKLQCLTCDGDGDCNKCGGSTYISYGGARAKCDRCRGTGDCRTCGGSGTRS